MNILSEDAQIESATGVLLSGTFTIPDHAVASPALVAVHGANDGTRDSLLLGHLQSLLPKAGIATLIFDRRGEGESTGSAEDADFADLAVDVGAWVEWVRRRPEIDATKVGLWSHSQGGWIATIVAADDPLVAFLIAVSPSGVSPAQQMNYATTSLLREAGYTEEVVKHVIGIRERLYGRIRQDTALEDIRAVVEAVRQEPWFELASLPDTSEDTIGLWRSVMDFDMRPTLRRLQIPVLLIFGEWDRWVPIEESIEEWRTSLNPAATQTVARPPGAGHYPTLAADLQDWSEHGPVAPAYEQAVLSWLHTVQVNAH